MNFHGFYCKVGRSEKFHYLLLLLLICYRQRQGQSERRQSPWPEVTREVSLCVVRLKHQLVNLAEVECPVNRTGTVGEIIQGTEAICLL